MNAVASPTTSAPSPSFFEEVKKRINEQKQAEKKANSDFVKELHGLNHTVWNDATGLNNVVYTR